MPSFPEPEEVLPLSFGQQRLWFLDQLNPHSPQYSVPAAFRLRGALRPDALEESLRLIIARHEILRTVYVCVDDEPAQKILDDAPFKMPTVDLSGDKNQDAELERRLREEAIRPFDLKHDLMLRAALFKLGPQEHVLFLNAHHIAFDEWSLQVLWRELGVCYEALRDGSVPRLEELPIQYADFAVWQRARAGALGPSEEYWKQRLAGDLPRLEFSTERPCAGPGDDRGARESLTLPRALASELRALARREGVTLHVLLLAAFQILLRRYCAQDDLIIGTPVAGRAHFQTEPLIGFFVNLAPVRVNFAGAPTFRELLQRGRQASLEACEHQELPFERIVELAHGGRRPRENPIFDVVFSTQHGAAAWNFADLTVEPIELETGTAKFKLTLVAQDRGEDLAFTAEYRVDCFSAESIRQMLESFQATLQAMASHPEAAVTTLPLAAGSAKTAEVVRRTATPAAPQTRLQTRLRDIWKTVLGHDSFGMTDDFFEIGGNSLLAVKLIAQVEKALGKKIALPILFQAPTIEKMAAALSDGSGPACGSCLVEIQPHGTKPPMFWLHTLGGGGGGGLFTYRKLAEALGPDQPSYGFVAPAQPFDSIEAMAARYVEEMRALQPTGPYRLGGYCFGGVVAYEMARQLNAAGQRVAVLAILDSSPPDPTGAASQPSLKLAWHAIKTLPGWLRTSDRASWQRVGQRLRHRLFGGRDRGASIDSPAQLETYVDMSTYPADYRRFAQAHWKALMNYRPLPCPIPMTLFKTDERHLFRFDSEEAWRGLVGNRLNVRRVTGKHEEILDHPHAGKLAAQLRELLESK